jgi:hypothetical protein
LSSKKQYYGLDEIGFIGTQSKDKARVQKDIDKTVQYLKDKKAGRPGFRAKKSNPVKSR